MTPRPMIGAAIAGLLLFAACTEQNRQPTLDPIAPQTVRVGEILRIRLEIRDPDGDTLDVSANPLPETAAFETDPDGTPVFVWAPLVSDTGPAGQVHDITLTVDDGRGGVAVRDISITVEPQSGAPEFLGPEGYILNLSEDDDISFLISVKDDDSAEVTLKVISAPIDNARFQQLDGKTASFYWKPDDEQRAIGNYWHLEIEAKDETYGPVRRRYSILLMNSDAAKSCPGTPPLVSACDEPSCVPLADLVDAGAVVFRVAGYDTESDIREMTLHYATNNPGDPKAYEGNTVDLRRCDPSQDAGCPSDPQERYFIGLMANPAATATQPLFLYYYVTGTDNDDFKGQSCDHTARLPKTGHFTLATYPQGWTGGCKDDVAEPNDAAADATLLEAGVTADLRMCVGSEDWYKVDVLPGATVAVDLLHEPRHGALALTLHDAAGTQVYPPDGGAPTEAAVFTPDSSPLLVRVAVPPGEKGADKTYGLVVGSSLGTCPNDAYEPNDSADQALFLLKKVTSREVSLCPGDRDWYAIGADPGESVLVDLTFQHAYGDLDLVLWNADGTQVLARSETTSSNEQITLHSSTGGTWLLEIRGYNGATNSAQLDIQVVETGKLCFEDGLSPNHTPGSAVLLPENTYYDLLVCPDKEDWFRLDVNAGEEIQVVAIPVYPENVTLELEMYSDADGTEIIGQPLQASEPGSAAWGAIAPEAGSLRWRVRTPGDYTAIYHLAFGVADGDGPNQCTDDRFSPTNTLESALSIDNEAGFVTRLKICPGGQDWFKIKGAAFEELFVYVFGFPDEAPLSAVLYRQQESSGTDGTTDLFKIADGLPTTDGVELRHLPEENAVFYIHVTGEAGEIHHYDLVIGLE